MASSGTVNSNAYSQRYVSFSWSIKSQSIANNQTTISWTLKGAGGPTNNYFMAAPFKVVIDGGTAYSSSTRIQLFNGTTVASGDYTITHNSDGNKTFDVSISAAIYVKSTNCTGSGSFALTQIPRQANITNAPNFNDTQNPTITYSNPAGNNVSSLQACIASVDGNNGYVAYRDIPKTGTSYTFNLTTAERNSLLGATTTANSLTVKFYIRTIIGGNNFYSSWAVTFSVVNANPSMNSVEYEDTNAQTTLITGSPAVIIRNNSTLAITVGNIWSYKQATLVNLKTTINGVTKTNNLSGTHATNVLVDFGTINVASDVTATLVATDSRGNKYTYNLPITVWDWVLPSAIITCQRQNNYYTQTDINVNADYSSLDNKNQITIQYQYKKTTDPDSSYSTLANLQDDVTTTFNIDNLYAWNIRVVLTDLLGSTTYNLFVDKGIPIFYVDRSLNSVGINCFPNNEKSLAVNGIDITPIVLYDNPSGTTGNITLSDSAANYSCLEIFYEKETQDAVKVLNPNGQEVVLSLNYYYRTANTFQIVEKTINISADSITVNTNQSYFVNIINNAVPTTSTENQIRIIKVVGYK